MDAKALQLAFQHSRFVRHFFFYPAITSTNDRAKELAAAGAEEGTVVIADAQTAGRGRADRSWFSPPGLGIYLSFIFRPEIPIEDAFGVLASVSLGVSSAVERLKPQGVVGIKWPNDLILEGRKLAGLLSEVGTSGGKIDWCVVGVGLNVNHTASAYPPDIKGKAISVRQACHREIDRVALLTDVVEKCAAWYEEFRERGMETVLEDWRRRSTILDRMVRVETAGETYVGTAVGIEDDGALRIRMESGADEVVRAGDVHLVQVR